MFSANSNNTLFTRLLKDLCSSFAISSSFFFNSISITKLALTLFLATAIISPLISIIT
nr:MAG TPA: hypothetical protein [Caudoviricetes sp.]